MIGRWKNLSYSKILKQLTLFSLANPVLTGMVCKSLYWKNVSDLKDPLIHCKELQPPERSYKCVQKCWPTSHFYIAMWQKGPSYSISQLDMKEVKRDLEKLRFSDLAEKVIMKSSGWKSKTAKFKMEIRFASYGLTQNHRAMRRK